MTQSRRFTAILQLILAVSFFTTHTPARAQGAQGLAPLVDPFIGTGGHGHTFPGATTPFGMVQLSPDTRYEGWDACGGYHYSDSEILGFSHLHLSGTGIPDYGDILFTPTLQRLDFSPGEDGKPSYRHRSAFSHSDEAASPGYYGVLLTDGGIRAEMTATLRCGFHRYTFPKSDSAKIIIDLLHGLGPDRVVESSVAITGNNEISGYRRSTGWAADQRVWFVAQFSKPFSGFGVVRNDSIIAESRADSGTNLRAFAVYRTGKVEEVLVKVGISSVGPEGARKNLRAEITDWDFEKVRQTAGILWEKELSRIVVEGGQAREKKVFYTALYHSMIAPNIQSDIDGSYRGMDMQVHTEHGFPMYTVFSLWDTFRALHPLLTLLDPVRTGDFIKSMLRKYQEGGALPVWELASNETGTMIGYHAVPVIADAYAKGVRGFDTTLALEAMKNSAGLNRNGLEAYRTYGYIPGDAEGESVSKTLEYAYDDWCISRFAQATGDPAAAAKFAERSQYYVNLFDPSTGFARPRVNGGWAVPFDPRAVTFHYTEANPWQYSFFAPHDVGGLIALFGGKDEFVKKLDSLFSGTPGTTGRDQADITGMIGQYAQGNEPSHNFAYLYAHAGAAWKTQQVVRTIMDSLYTDRPDGLCGNDDCGQMSAWYVFGALGFYPVTPGAPVYTVGSPLFPRVRINFPNRRMFVVQAAGASHANRFIQSAAINGRPIGGTTLRHDVITAGGEVVFTMGPEPNRELPDAGPVYAEYAPKKRIVPVPFFSTSARSFTDTMTLAIESAVPGTTIYYTTDGTIPNFSSPTYSGPLALVGTTSVHAIAALSGRPAGGLLYGEFVRHTPVGSIALRTAYSPQYPGGGDSALVDGLRGAADFRLGAWQGYEGDDIEAVVDLGDTATVTSVALGCLQDINSWIFFPTAVEVSVSLDGTDFSIPVVVRNDIPAREEGARLKEFEAKVGPVQARFVRVVARSLGTCPEWHKGAGGKAWLFTDEIVIR
jgi:predicted alpha-1,2-mannosidase